VGFLDIDGFSAHDLCAVGYKGEIWHYDGKWHAQKSPTDRALTRVIPLDSGDWVAVGLAGTILTGRAGRWQEIKQSATEMDFWGGVTFKGQVILATGEGLFTLQGKKVKPLNIGVKGSRTTGFLHAAEGVLWSVGAKDIFRSEDGVKWKRVPNP
jgi:hypothetical protein